MLSPSKHESAPGMSPLKRLPSPKARFPLLDERLHALLLILGSEENLEGLAFEHQPRLERAVLSGKQDLLDLHDGERRHLGDLARHLDAASFDRVIGHAQTGRASCRESVCQSV